MRENRIVGEEAGIVVPRKSRGVEPGHAPSREAGTTDPNGQDPEPREFSLNETRRAKRVESARAYAKLLDLRKIDRDDLPAGVEALAEAVIGDKDIAQRWMSEPNPALDERAPRSLLGSEDGCARVRNLLMRIECGVLA